jgi:hypothetical protein
MAQLTIYLDEQSIRRIEEAASAEQLSVSRWVKARLVRSLDGEWPVGYFSLEGSLEEHDLRMVAEPNPAYDAPREPL